MTAELMFVPARTIVTLEQMHPVAGQEDAMGRPNPSPEPVEGSQPLARVRLGPSRKSAPSSIAQPPVTFPSPPPPVLPTLPPPAERAPLGVEWLPQETVDRPTHPLDTRQPPETEDPVVLHHYHPTGATVGFDLESAAADMGGAVKRRDEVLASFNDWVQWSVDGGATWKEFDPTVVFPDPLAGGFCCDQVVLYVPAVDHFVWYMQHNADADGGAFRLAIASTAELLADFNTAWSFRDIRASMFGLGTSDLDFPDLACSTRFLYVSTDVVDTSSRLVMRLPLDQLVASGPVDAHFAHDKNLLRPAVLTRFVQNGVDGVYWGGQVGNSTIRLYQMLDGGPGNFTYKDIPVATWPDAPLSAIGPDGNDWLSRCSPPPGSGKSPVHPLLGGVRSGDRIFLAWMAGAGDNGRGGFRFPNAHVRIVEINVQTQSLTREYQIWHPEYSYAYPALGANLQGEIAVMVGWSGRHEHANTAMGILGDYEVWYRDSSTRTPARWGDFLTVRSTEEMAGRFGGFGYWTEADDNDAGKCILHPFYAEFGRKSLGP